MIQRIELTNFMSHERTVIEPAPGLTVLVGPNNCGKSAVVTALQLLSHNADSTFVMRHGEKECSIRVETDDGHLVEWRRKNSPSYSIDGEKFDRLGRNGVPDQLHKVLRLPRIAIGEDQVFDVHYGEQKVPIFLLDKPASHAAKFFASSSDVDRFLKMQDLHRSKVADAKTEKQRLEQTSIRLNHELQVLEPLANLDRSLKVVEDAYRYLDELTKSITQLALDSEKLSLHEMVVGRCMETATLLSQVSPPPQMAPTELLEDLIDDFRRADECATFISTQVDVVSELKCPPEMAPADALDLLVNQLDCADRQLTLKHCLSTVLSPLVDPPPLEDVELLQRLKQELCEIHRLVERSSGESIASKSLGHPPQLQDDIALAATVEQLTDARRHHTFGDRARTVLTEVVSPPVLTDWEAGNELLKLLRYFDGRTAAYARATKLLSIVKPVSTEQNTSELEEMINRLDTGAVAMTSFATATARTLSDFAQAKEQLLKWATLNGVCPTCGGALDGDLLVAHLCTTEAR